jgi:hypothetical protein
MRKTHLLICPVLLLFCPPSFAQESSRSGSAKQDAPKVIATDDMKLAMKAGKLETVGKYDEALKVYAQAIDLRGRFTPFVYHNRGMLYLHRKDIRFAPLRLDAGRLLTKLLCRSVKQQDQRKSFQVSASRFMGLRLMPII